MASLFIECSTGAQYGRLEAKEGAVSKRFIRAKEILLYARPKLKREVPERRHDDGSGEGNLL